MYTILLESTKEPDLKYFKFPTTTHTDDEIEEFCKDVITISQGETYNYEIIMGEFNANIDKKQGKSGKLVGNYGFGNRNERGETLLNFMGKYFKNF